MKRRKILAERVRDISRGDEGVAAVVVAISLLALLGAAMISIDAGSVWSSRREAVTATDAAALGAARSFAAKPLGACDAGAKAEAKDEATLLVASNRPGSEVTKFEVSAADCSIGAGTVDVKATGKAPLFFAPVFNIKSADVESSSTAQWGPISEIQRLRPLALCIEDPHVQEWITLGRTPGLYSLLDGVDDPLTPNFDHPGDSEYPNAGVVHRIVNTEENDCDPDDKLKSNWAWIDFNGKRSPNGSSALRRWLEDGFEDEISLGAQGSGDEDCRLDQKGFDTCEGKPRKEGNIDKSLARITCASEVPTEECQMFPVLIYDLAEENRDKGEYHPFAYLGIVLRNAVGVGKGSDDDDDEEREERYFDLEFVNLVWQGTIAPDGAADFPVVHAVQICRTDQGKDNCDV